MMKCRILILFFLTSTTYASGQQNYSDSLKQQLKLAKEDTNKVNVYAELASHYQWSYPDTSLAYSYEGLKLARKLNFTRGEIYILGSMSESLSQKGNYPKALEAALNALQLIEKSKDSSLIIDVITEVGHVYFYSGDYQKALFYYLKSFKYIQTHKQNNNNTVRFISGFLGETYFHLSMPDSALFYLQQEYDIDITKKTHWAVPYYYLGAVFSEKGNYHKALEYYKEGIAIASKELDYINGYISIAGLFKKMNTPDSAIYYTRQAVTLAGKTAMQGKLSDASELLAGLYKESGAPDSALKYSELSMVAKDSLYKQARQNLSFNEQLYQQEIANETEQTKNKIRTYVLLGVLALFLLIGFFLWRNNRQKQKANILLQEQKKEIDSQRSKAENTLEELKVTQHQLIQSEKMASLGELTAGIAHEIQNPLNFVNNFSEVNSELIDEMQEEMEKGNYPGAKEISNDIKDNEEKIKHHGKRADAIVRGMLQHSRVSSGQKEPTDINALANEYLRLAYHGFRAKDSLFNAIPIAIGIETDFDTSIGKINIIPQDIGRVLVNLVNNAFYAVTEKRKQIGEPYEPTATVMTKKIRGHVEIRVKDNGTGIAQKSLDEIFQPFFTTKPSGQGTGLGLSLAYDIITKGHGGELKVETKEGEGSEFILQLPG